MYHKDIFNCRIEIKKISQILNEKFKIRKIVSYLLKLDLFYAECGSNFTGRIYKFKLYTFFSKYSIETKFFVYKYVK